MPEDKWDILLNKLTTRNLVALMTAFTLNYEVIYATTHVTEVLKALENPLVTFILGTFNTVVIMVFIFYFRKSQSKESTPS